ncbi:cytochrome c oxidase subunit IVB [Aquibacillus koreensis]|uniref:Cytochrome c oxidase subunit IVB n=1 Tax=Aquibacillus koreensis TaxID=279446 RepID=A0A9X3WL05_9BACI|nr:cytochrome c oxidase subunit IVB [Aquibacillus koreensis]MCT2538092.1 cytochrome c oxidase subunit IVB [Aquibacillus koreensis]MDC3420615.1 cytochrome c oxidase subunit IVB [Aquibacillus koreensis]
MAENTNSVNNELDYHKKKKKEEMKQQVITFALMIVFTIIAFTMVEADLDKLFVIPILFILAIVQVAFQLYYFMHMSHKGHEMPSLMMYGGAAVAFLTVLTLLVLVWW